MIWTKLKKRCEDLLPDALQGRVKYHATRYGRGVSYFMSRAWVTLDGEEIANFSTIKHYVVEFQRAGSWYPHDPELTARLHQEGLFTRDEFVNALETLVDSKPEEGLASSDPLLRTLAMFDRRVGKRRLQALDMAAEHALAQRFFEIRCTAEGMRTSYR